MTNRRAEQRSAGKTPTISVVLPVFNAQDFIKEAIHSILQQTFEDFELIILDDASTDSSPEIVASIVDSRIRLVRNPTNYGLVRTLNLGVSIAKGEFIARMDHDDIALPDRFARQLEFLAANPEIAVLGTGYQLIDSSSRRGLTYRPPQTSNEVEWATPFLCPVAHPTVMMRRSVIMAHGGYAEEAQFAEDYDLWERVLRTEKISNLPEVLLLLRKHNKNMTSLWASENARIATKISMRRINYVLDTDIGFDVACCICSQCNACAPVAGRAIALIELLLAKAKLDNSPNFPRLARDAAKRIAVIGIHSHNLKTILIANIRAFFISPGFIITLCQNVISRKRGHGSISIVG